MLGDHVGGLESLVSVVFVMASIALGTLVGVSLYKWTSDRARRIRRPIVRGRGCLPEHPGRLMPTLLDAA
jgi:hypothetical protein